MISKALAVGVLAGSLCFGAATNPTGDLRLIEAVKSRNQKSIDALLSAHADVNVAQPDGATPLAWAVFTNQVETAERLIKAGAKVETSDEYGDTPLTLACSLGNGDLIEKLLAAGANPNAARWNGETALMLASRSGSQKGVKLLLERGAKPDAIDINKGQNALMWAAAEGHSEVIDLLLKAGADPKAVTKSGFNALVFAVQRGDRMSVARLLDAGLDVNYKLPDNGPNSGPSVLQFAVMGGKSDAAMVLIDKGANVKVADAAGITPLHVASQAGNLKLVNALLAKQADPNAKTAKLDAAAMRQGGGFRPVSGELTPLQMAARADKVDVMRALVAAGADPKLKSQDGTTLLMAAAGSGHVEAVQYAFELDPDVNAVTDRKSSVMHAAVTGSMQLSTQPEICKVIKFLADKGADPDPLDGRGRTPITIANVLPIDNAVTLLTQIIEASGKTPKQSPKR